MSNLRDNYPALRYVDQHEKDTSEECRRCKGNCGYIGMVGEWACEGFIPKTNSDRIRAMTDEELAEWLEVWGNFETGYALDWLKQEVSDDNET